MGYGSADHSGSRWEKSVVQSETGPVTTLLRVPNSRSPRASRKSSLKRSSTLMTRLLPGRRSRVRDSWTPPGVRRARPPATRRRRREPPRSPPRPRRRGRGRGRNNGRVPGSARCRSAPSLWFSRLCGWVGGEGRDDAGQQRRPLLLVDPVQVGRDERAAHREQEAEVGERARRQRRVELTAGLADAYEFGDPVGAFADVVAHRPGDLLV